jgi:DNA-binding CsgD family transcriptional regulator
MLGADEPAVTVEEAPGSPFVGRAAEQGLIERLSAEVREERHGRLLLVAGLPGVGLLRFLREVERTGGETVECALARPGYPRIESLLDDLDRHPRLFVVGAQADGRDGDPTPPLFRPWLAHPNVVQLRLERLTPEALGLIVRSRCPHASTGEVATIVRVSSGSPAVATELCRWHARVVDGREELGDADALAAAPLLACRIGSSPAVRVQELAAACDGPIQLRGAGRLLGEPIDAVRELLDHAAAGGLLVRSETTAATGYAVSHPLVRTVIRALAGERRWAEIHRRLADGIIADAGEADLAGPRATVIARHLAAAADLPANAARYFRAAAEAAEREADLPAARRWALLGLAADADRHEECRLLMIIGSVDERLHAVAQGVSTLVRAHGLAEQIQDGALLLEAAVRLLDASRAGSPVPIDDAAVAEQALAVAAAGPPVLRARLHAHLAIRSAGRDGEASRRHLAVATGLARSVDDGGAAAAMIRAVSCLPHPAQVADCLRAVEHALALAGGDRLNALPGAVFANFALARPAAVEVALEQFATVERAHPSRWARMQLAGAALGLAVLDLDEARFVAAAREAVAEAASPVVRYVDLGVELWQALTGRRLTVLPRPADEPGDPRRFAALTSAVRLLGPRPLDPGPRTDASLRESLDDVLAWSADPLARPDDGTWSTWMAAAVRAAMAADRPDLCRRALDELSPYADQLVVLGHALPVGPVGWYLASALHWLDRIDEALEANARATATSRRARSRLWTIHCYLQRAELLALRDPLQAPAVRRAALAYAQRFGMQDVVPPTRQRQNGVPRAAAECRTAGASQQRSPLKVADEVRASVGSLGMPDLDILLLLMDGAGNAAIARVTRLSISTVERRLSRLYRLLGVSNRAHAIAVVTPLRADIHRLVARPGQRPL